MENMWYSFLGILITIVSISLIIILIVDFRGKISNHLFKGKTAIKIIKIVVPFICIIALYIIGNIYYYTNQNVEHFSFMEIYDIISYTIRALIFDVEKEKLALLMANNNYYLLAWKLAYPLCVLASYINIFNAILYRMVNWINVLIALRKDCDILIGTDYAEIYKDKSSNLVIWIEQEITKEKELELIKLNIPFINKQFTKDNLLTIPYLKRAIKRHSNKEKKGIDYHFISFQDEETNLKYLSEFKGFLNTEFKQFLNEAKEPLKIYQTKNYFLHIELSNTNLLSIQNKIQADSEKLSQYLLFFNRYQLLALKFNEENPITKYLPKTFINDFGAIENTNNDINNIISQISLNDDLIVQTPYDKHINVLYFGFGKVSREIHKISVMNNQLVSYFTNANEPSNRYHNHVINYFAVDKESFNTGDKNSLFYNNRFDNIKKTLEKKSYYQFPEDTANFYPLNTDINNINTYQSLIKLLESQNELRENEKILTYNQIIISLDNDLDNIDYALKMLMLLKQRNIENYHIYVRLKQENQGVVDSLKQENITFFGYYSDMFSHDIIVKDSLIRIAKLVNSKYNEKIYNEETHNDETHNDENHKTIDWYDLPPIKYKSNIYSGISTRLKLNLLGLDYKIVKKNELKCKDIKENNEYYNSLKEKLKHSFESYKDYLFYNEEKKPSVANILSFQEHLRWNAFYLSSGYIPMKKPESNDPNFKKDCDITKQHICLTTYQGLYLWHLHLYSKQEQFKNQKIEDVGIKDLKQYKLNTYSNDYMLIELFEEIFRFYKVGNDKIDDEIDDEVLLLIKKEN